MKKKDVKIGTVYAAKISGKITRVRILDESPYGGWDARNEVTGRMVRIKSAAKLRYPVTVVLGDFEQSEDEIEQARRLVDAPAPAVSRYEERQRRGLCVCCGGDPQKVGPLDDRGHCMDCRAEYRKPEYRDDFEPFDAEEE